MTYIELSAILQLKCIDRLLTVKHPRNCVRCNFIHANFCYCNRRAENHIRTNEASDKTLIILLYDNKNLQ